MEQQIVGQLLARAPDRPADTRVDEAVLVARDVDRLDGRQPEVPDQVGVGERRHEAAGGRVDVQRHVPAGLLVELLQHRVELLDGLELSGVRRAENTHDGDRVLVDQRLGLGHANHGALVRHVNAAQLDVEVARELVPDDLHVGPRHDVRLVGRLALGSAAGAPVPLERESGQHHGLRRADGRGTDRGLSRGIGIEEVGDDRDAAALKISGLRVLGCVNEIDGHRLHHQLARLRVHPGRHERREVEQGVAVERQIVMNDLVRGIRSHLSLGQRPLRDRSDHRTRPIEGRDLGVVLLVLRQHGALRSRVGGSLLPVARTGRALSACAVR